MSASQELPNTTKSFSKVARKSKNNLAECMHDVKELSAKFGFGLGGQQQDLNACFLSACRLLVSV